jgi:hypothetical protein
MESAQEVNQLPLIEKNVSIDKETEENLKSLERSFQ